VRLPSLSPSVVGHVLDAGAQGVICPLVNTPAEAEELVRACLYPPLGSRSFGPFRSSLMQDWDFNNSNEGTVKLAMIETRQGLDNVRDIVRTPGLDGLFVGPFDLGIGLGRPLGDMNDPELREAIQLVRATAHDAGAKAGVFCRDGHFAAEMIELGFDLVVPGSDMGVLLDAASRSLVDCQI